VNRWKADLGLGFNALIWGMTFVLVKGALHQISPLLFLTFRFAVAALALLALYHRRLIHPAPDSPPVSAKVLAAGAMTGAFLFCGYLLQTVGLKSTTAPKSAFLTGLCTVMVPLLAALVYKIRPRISEVAGVVTATIGMGFMTLEGPIDSISRGDVLTFGAAIAFAAQIVATGHYAERIGFEVMSITQMSAAAVCALSLFWWVETPTVHWQPLVVWAILITGLLCTALAFTIQAWAQRHTTSTRTALIYALEPVAAWMTSYYLAGEGLSRQAAAGAVLILAGVLLVEVKPFQSRSHL
jgi:drug/metabolite transporter (DMT)-like permease